MYDWVCGMPTPQLPHFQFLYEAAIGGEELQDSEAATDFRVRVVAVRLHDDVGFVLTAETHEAGVGGQLTGLFRVQVNEV